MDKKNQLLDLLERSQQNELRFIAGLTEKEGAVSGTVQDWAVKDEVAHVAAWKAIMSDRCRAFMTNEEPRDYSDVDADVLKAGQAGLEENPLENIASDNG